MNKLYPTFYQHVLHYQLIEPGNTIILGFSGGKDSVTLLCLLQQLQKDLDFHLVAAYFNHRLRTDQGKEEQWVRDFCASRQVELVVGSKNILAFKEKNKLNLEHAASISRYHFFQKVSAQFPQARVATAHTQSDLTETFLIKLLRGSGLQGLSTIYHKKENTIIRPLLWFDEKEILAFLERNEIKFYQDYTNQEDQFLRNRIRHHIVPPIQAIEPGIHDKIFKTVHIIQAEYDYFSSLAETLLEKHLVLGKILPATILSLYHPAIQRHIIREYVRRLKGNLLNIDFEHIEAIRTRYQDLGGLAIPGVELTFHKGFIYPHAFSIPAYQYGIPGPFDTHQPGKQTRKTRPGILIEEIGQYLIIETIKTFKKPRDNHSIIVPFTLLHFPLCIRAAQKKDKYMKINTSIYQDVFEMIRASGIPADLRNLCPVLLNGDGQIIWVKGSPVANNFKVTGPAEKNLVKIKIS